MKENFKILTEFVKDASTETSDVQTYLFVKDNLSKYHLNIDVLSKTLKNKLIEVNTTLKFEDKEPNEKKSHFEMTYVSIVKINEEAKKEDLKKILLCDVQNKIYPNLEIVNWGEISDFDMIINATSLGLKSDDEIKLNYKKIGSNKLFYDVIYKSEKTNFLLEAEKYGNKTENGKMMFIYQAHQSFTIWHKVMPKIDEETIKLLD